MRTLSRVATTSALSVFLNSVTIRSRCASQRDTGLAHRLLQHAVEAITGKMLDEACAEQRMDLGQLIAVHDPLAPHSVHVHEVNAFACVSRRDFGPAQ